ncbi:MAG: N-acetyl-gamma-glutamyl-phosphate reductase [Thaumarchaeota archaeon]|nr:N-acetyl-gamma-glutamyl-phosphate reductase [Nitrososphaerota archaeon]
MKVGVIGGTGFVGGELLRLLLQHPKIEVVFATSRQHSGEPIQRTHPNLRGFTDLQFTEQNPANVGKVCDLVFTAVPHGTAVELVTDLVKTGVRIIDMSADFRLQNPQDYSKWYGYEHDRPDLISKFTYGVPELHRSEIKSSNYVSCPGCMAVTSILALAPIIRSGLIDLERIVVDAKIGSSGAGIEPSAANHHAERYGVVRPYKPVGHRHTAEIEQELAKISGKNVKVAMSAHGVNMVRGILVTCHTFLKREIVISDIWKSYRASYQDEPFVRLVRDKRGLYRFPDPKILVGSNFCDIGFDHDTHTNRLVILAAIDNLMKGAAGSAIQCMNLMFGFPETEALMTAGIHPV